MEHTEGKTFVNGETDDWAHDGRYDRVLEAYARSDRYLAQLWTWLESQPHVIRSFRPNDLMKGKEFTEMTRGSTATWAIFTGTHTGTL